jgi:hypothetical protein
LPSSLPALRVLSVAIYSLPRLKQLIASFVHQIKQILRGDFLPCGANKIAVSECNCAFSKLAACAKVKQQTVKAVLA